MFDGTDVEAIIDWDTAGPSTRAWDLAYTAHHFVPFHKDEDLQAWGWSEIPDRRRRLRLMLDSYDGVLTPAEIVDTAILRIQSMGLHIANRVRVGDPRFAIHARDGHAEAYFQAAISIGRMREQLI